MAGVQAVPGANRAHIVGCKPLAGFYVLDHKQRTAENTAAAFLLAAVELYPCLVAMAYWMTPADQATPLGRLKWEVEREGAPSRLFAGRLSSYPLIFRVIGEYPLSGVGVVDGLLERHVGDLVFLGGVIAAGSFCARAEANADHKRK